MISCPNQGDHRLPGNDEAAPAGGQRPGISARGQPLSARDVPRLIAAYLDNCAPCVAQMRGAAVFYSGGAGGAAPVAVLVAAWLSEAAVRLEASGSALPETAAAAVAGLALSLPTRLLVGLVPLAGPERPGGPVRVTTQEVGRALAQFAPAHGRSEGSDWPRIFDDALEQFAALLSNTTSR